MKPQGSLAIGALDIICFGTARNSQDPGDVPSHAEMVEKDL